MHLIRLFAFACLCAFAAPALGQVSDNFTDGNFDQNPAWQGDAANFTVNAASELQLNATAAGTSALAVQGNIPTAAAWDFHFRLAFSPSTSNLLRIYLLADQSSLGTANGYFLEIGETGSTDALRLFRQDAGAKTLLATGELGLVAVNPDIHLSVARTSAGVWTVQAASGTGALTQQCTATDATYSGGASQFFGVQCVYTVSNITKYYFDDLAITLGPPDTDPPVLLAATADNANQVTAVFSEPLDPITAGDASNYSINGGIGAPASAVLQPDQKSVVLALSTGLATGAYSLQTIGIKDVAGNASAAQSTTFQFTFTESAAEYDILINEIMADPTPTHGLPEVEYLELYNRSNKTLDLAALRIQDATGTPVALPTFLLQPGAYAAIAATANVAALQAATAGQVLGLSASTSLLNNDGDVLTLSKADGTIIDRVAYDLSWHTDPVKKDGGWSLERINPGLPCQGSENWKSCPLTNGGGTPGLANAALSTAPDVTAPRILGVATESATSLLVSFSESLDFLAAQQTSAYKIKPSIAVATAEPLTGNHAQVRLTLASPLQNSILYALTGASALADCSGNGVAPTDTAYFGLSEIPDQFDVVINEIMSKPSPSAGLPVGEYLELLNRSNKIVDLAALRVQDLSGSPVTLPSYILAPGQYVVVTPLSNAAALQASTAGVVLGSALSSTLMNDDGDVITLSTANGAVIDRVAYDPSWHTETGKEDGGWSLERINFNLPCVGSENWQSCPVLPGGTPGARNASFQNTTDEKPPYLLWAYVESPNSLLLTFSDGLDKTTTDNPGDYHFDPPISIQSADIQSNVAQVRLSLGQPLQTGVVYTLTLGSAIADCSGNTVTGVDTLQVGIPQKPEVGDLIINEVMFNPASGNPRYVEFYNRSNKIFDWSAFFIADFSDGASVSQITQKRLAIPGQFHVFSPDANNVREHFQNIILRNVMENSLPTWNDKIGNVTLYWAENGDTVVLDALDYSDSWHNGLYSVGDRDGVALERVRIDGLTNDAANWTSAATNVTGAPGTPTLPNSQRLDPAASADNLITLEPARLSPDGDGYEDFLDIRYNLPQEGYAATIAIFDADGNLMKRLVRESLIGTEGSLRWDGDASDGSKARPGIYILFMEIFSPNGDVQRVKKVFAVVAKK